LPIAVIPAASPCWGCTAGFTRSPIPSNAWMHASSRLCSKRTSVQSNAPLKTQNVVGKMWAIDPTRRFGMNYCRYVLQLLATIATSLAISTVAQAQNPEAPRDLKLDGDSKTIRLSWTAPSGAANTYLVERAGPGYTLFTQIAGPISQTDYVVDTTGACGSENYTYRVRAVDSASNRGPYSNTISTSTLRVLCNLPLVGRNVLDLLDTLPGFRLNVPSDAFSFVLTGVKERTVTFAYTDGS